MSNGPGKYDELCTMVREATNADGVIVIVVRGDKGSGFSAQASLAVQLALPDVLEETAAMIRADMAQGITLGDKP